MDKKRLLLLLVPAVIMLLIAPFTPDWDLRISSLYFQDGKFFSSPFVQFFYHYGFLLADFLAIISLFIIIPFFRRYRAAAALFLFTFVIGSGLITHAILKDHWGRPRPAQLKEFGGEYTFRSFYSPNLQLSSQNKSFPCGHCTAGFCFISFIFIGIRQKSLIFLSLGIFLTLTLGLALSYTRIAMGGHFFSDALLSALIMYWTALVGDWLIYDKLRWYEGVNKTST